MFQAAISAARMLSEHGVAQTILCRAPSPHHDVARATTFGEGVTLIRVGRGSAGWRDKAAFALFGVKACRLVRDQRPQVIIAYNLFAVVVGHMARRFWPEARMVYHNFDLADPDDMGRIGRLMCRIEHRAARRADKVVVSSPGRARVFQDQADLAETPISLYNSQRRDDPLVDSGELRRVMAEHDVDFETVVLHLGSIGPKHGLEATIRSIPSWRAGWGLVVAGFPEGAFPAAMAGLAADLGVQRRVLFLHSVGPSLWDSCLAEASVGISLYEAVNVNHAHMAGASQKMSFYLKAGVPVIVPTLSDFQSLLARFPCGVAADPEDARSVGDAVNAVISDPDRYDAFCDEARSAFETEYNFEKQFEPILRWLLSVIYPSHVCSGGNEL